MKQANPLYISKSPIYLLIAQKKALKAPFLIFKQGPGSLEINHSNMVCHKRFNMDIFDDGGFSDTGNFEGNI